jgi:light-regulated signal transduction histidine kinase (bacteriophytochrome)
LSPLVAERTAKLQQLVEDLEHFSYTITHDMRAPLRAMRNFAQIINDENVDEGQREFTGPDYYSGKRMDGLIVGALNYSKAVREELPLAPIDVGKLIQGMLDTYPEFQSSRAHINVERDIALVTGKRSRLDAMLFPTSWQRFEIRARRKTAEVRVWSEQRDRWAPVGRPWQQFRNDAAASFSMFSRGQVRNLERE